MDRAWVLRARVALRRGDVRRAAGARRPPCGQTREVTVYRLLCAKTYEVKMCERASHKLALDRAVLGSASAQQALSKREVEELLKRGAYDFFSDQVRRERLRSVLHNSPPRARAVTARCFYF